MTDEPAEIAVQTAPEAERTEGNRIVPNVSGTLPAEEVARITTDLIGVLKTVYDPEIPVDIVELGLVYVCDVLPMDDGRFRVAIQMTLTAPGCGMGESIADEVCDKVLALPQVGEATVDIVFDPPWDRSMMSEAALLTLGL